MDSATMIQLTTHDKDHRLSFATRHANDRGETLIITMDNLGNLINLAPKTFREKADAFLQWIERKTLYAGAGVQMKPSEFPLAHCRNESELAYMREFMTDMGYLRDNSPGILPSALIILPKGWQHLETLSALRPDSRKAFVAMSFDKKLRYIFNDGIKPACEANGFEAIRVDDQEYNEVVYDKIIAGIRESRFVIADVTQQKNGVYFEGGFAKGLGLTVIWTWKSDELKKPPHFDIQHFNHIHWKTIDELREKLELRIRATIGSIKKA
jgi:hypothetical protein